MTALDDLSTGTKDNLEGIDTRLVEGSILDVDALDESIGGRCDTVIHLAARPSVPRSLADPALSNRINVDGTVAVLEAARRADNAHVIVASSSSIYGANTELPKHEGLLPMPVSPYAVSKLATESYAMSYQWCFGLPALAFRFFNVYGPGQAAGHAYAAVIPAFVDAALSDRPLPVHGDGNQTRDFTFVGSLVALLARAAEERTTSQRPVNLAFGTRISLLEVAAELESVLGRSLPRDHTEPRAGDVRDSMADQTRLRALFPDAEPTPFAEGLRATVDWIRASR